MLLNEKFEVHNTLNPKLWDKDKKLHPDVEEKLNEIVLQFIDNIDVPINVADILLVGSNCNYNYHANSDLDVHIISNYSLIDSDPEILQALYNALKTKFNQDYDIKLHGIDVELYVQDINSTTTSNGIYSLKNKRWIKMPNKIEQAPEFNLDNDIDLWKANIEKTIRSKDSDLILGLVDELYMIRKDSLDAHGEYSRGNQLFKEIRNLGLLDDLKDAYKKSRAKELSLERYLREDTRNALLNKSKSSAKGFERFKKRVKSRVANSVKEFNKIDMNKLFKDNILTVNINVKGETDNYQVKISFGGFLDLLRDQLKKQNDILDLKSITRALINGFNKDDVYIHCSCPDATYRMNFFQTKNKISSGDPELRPSNITNPNDTLGAGCKHVLLVLSNTSWILKVGSTIFNYINYMEKNYKKMYADIIYPAVYGKKYEDPVQLDIEDSDELDSTTSTIDASNKYAVDKTRFLKGNTQGIRFTRDTSEDQLSIDDESE